MGGQGWREAGRGIRVWGAVFQPRQEEEAARAVDKRCPHQTPVQMARRTSRGGRTPSQPLEGGLSRAF